MMIHGLQSLIKILAFFVQDWAKDFYQNSMHIVEFYGFIFKFNRLYFQAVYQKWGGC